MNIVKAALYTVFGVLMISTAMAPAADKQQDRLRSHTDAPQYPPSQDQTQIQDQIKLQDQDRLRLHSQDPQFLQTEQQKRIQEQKKLQIYGAEVMTPKEQENYRKQYSSLQSEKERIQFQHEHQMIIQHRAQSAGVAIPGGNLGQPKDMTGKSLTTPPLDDATDIGENATNRSGRQRSGSSSGGGQGGGGSNKK